jgi:hypothetical protein
MTDGVESVVRLASAVDFDEILGWTFEILIGQILVEESSSCC